MLSPLSNALLEKEQGKFPDHHLSLLSSLLSSQSLLYDIILPGHLMRVDFHL